MSNPEINFIEYKEKNLKDYTLIEGLPGMGLVGTIAAKYVIEKLNFDDYGYIESSLFLPVVRIHNGVPVRPARIYISDSKKLVVLISEQIIPKNHTYALAKSVSEWIQKKGISSLISLSGIHAYDNDPEQPIIYGIAANDKSKEVLKKNGLRIIEDGITTGVTALILLNLKKTNVNAISILGNVKIAADYQAAAEVLKKLNEITALNIDVKPLMLEAKQVEREIVENLKKFKTTKDSTEKFEDRTLMTA